MASDDKVDTLSTTTSHMPLLGSSKNDRDTHSEPSTSSSLTSDINRNGAKSTDEDNNSIGNNKEKELLLQQGVVLLEDAINYRSIHHKMDMFSISLYRWYHSAHVTWAIYIVIIVLMSLAFLEDPSSLSWSSDPRRNQLRYQFPAGLIEGIDFMCLAIILVSTMIQSYLSSHFQRIREFPKRHPWLMGSYIVLACSIADLCISLALQNDFYRWRLRRLLRPYFLAANSRMLKKTLKCIKQTLPEIASVLLLLLLHVYFFMMLGMLIFPKGGFQHANGTHSELNNTEWLKYFSSVDTAFKSLLVLLTTANNPDVMMPAYSQNRLYSLYFIGFSLIGTFLIFNLLTAVVYNQFRGYFQNSMQSSHFRRYVALSAAFVVLTECNEETRYPDVNIEDVDYDAKQVEMKTLKNVMSRITLKPEQTTTLHHNLAHLGSDINQIDKTEFKQIFTTIDSLTTSEVLVPVPPAPTSTESSCRRKIQVMVLHPCFNIIGNCMVLINTILITIEIAIHYEKAFRAVFSRLNIVNYAFAAYYTIEQTLKVIALGKIYFFNLNMVYDGIITVALLVVELVQLGIYGGMPADISTSTGSKISLWDCARIVNILVMLRLLRIIPNFKPMARVTSSLIEIMRNLASFGGVLAIIFYVFGIIGMLAFENKTNPIIVPGSNISLSLYINPSMYECGSYEQLEYWANNFNDFASSLVVLWDIMVINNWGVFLDMFTRRVGIWSQLYFIAWWILAVIISLNLFIALILDHFIAKWDRAQENEGLQTGRRGTIQALFQSNMHEPNPTQINREMLKHPCLRWYASDS